MRVRDALDSATTGVLRRIAAAHGLPVDDATTRSELVQQIEGRLADPEALAHCLAELSPRERRSLDVARTGGGEIRGFLLSRVLGEDPGAIQHLMDLGMLFRTFAPLGPHRGELFAVPDEVLALLSPEGNEEPTIAVALPGAVEEPPREERRTSDPAYSLFTLASFVRRHAVGQNEGDTGVRAAGFRAETQAWTQEPGGWEWQERWAFLRHIALAAGFLEHRSDGATGPTSTLRTALHDRAKVVERLWRGYLAERDWSELERAEVPHAADLSDQIEAPAARSAVLRVLGRLGGDAWRRLDDVVAWIGGAAPTFIREQLDTRSAALTDPDTHAPLFGEGSWERIEAPYLRYLLLGPLYWLGVIASDTSGERIRITEAGTALLGGVMVPPSRTADPCTWSPRERRLLAPARADLGTLLAAERYLLLEQRGPVSVYRLDRDRVATALSGGASITECRELLTHLTQAALPPSVEEALTEWSARFGAFALRPTVLMEAREAADLEAAIATPEVQALVRRRIGPTTVEVPASHTRELEEALRAAGQLPRVDAALRLMAGRKAYAALVDEHVLEFLLVSLLAFRQARPEQLTRLEGSLDLLERLESLFPPERLEGIQAAAATLAGELRSSGAGARSRRTRQTRERPRR